MESQCRNPNSRVLEDARCVLKFCSDSDNSCTRSLANMTVFLLVFMCCMTQTTEAWDAANSTFKKIDTPATLLNDDRSYVVRGAEQHGLDTMNLAANIDERQPDDNDIDEDSIDILYPDWILQTRSFDTRADKTTVTVFKRDGSVIVRNVVSSSGIDWANKTRVVDSTNDTATLTVFDNDGSSLILELDRRSDRVKETWHSRDGTTTIRQVAPTTVEESGTQRSAVEGVELKTTSGHDSFELKNITRPDGSVEFWRTNLKTRHANGTLVFANGTQEIVTTHPKLGFKNVTLIFLDGRREIRGFNPTTGAEVLELVSSNGTSTSEVIDDRIAGDLVDLLHPLWTRKLREVDPETGAITLTIYSSDGTCVNRRVKGTCKKYLHDDCHRAEFVREIDPNTGHETIVQLGSAEPTKSSKILSTYVHNVRKTMFDTARRMSLFTERRTCQPGYFMYRGVRCRRKMDLFGTY